MHHLSRQDEQEGRAKGQQEEDVSEISTNPCDLLFGCPTCAHVVIRSYPQVTHIFSTLDWVLRSTFPAVLPPSREEPLGFGAQHSSRCTTCPLLCAKHGTSWYPVRLTSRVARTEGRGVFFTFEAAASVAM